MTKIDSLPDYPEYDYAWRIDMVPNTICNFSTTGSAYFEKESGISVYYTKDKCGNPDDVSNYAT